MNPNLKELSKEASEETIAAFIEHNKPIFALMDYARQEFGKMRTSTDDVDSEHLGMLRDTLKKLLYDFMELNLPPDLKNILTADLKVLVEEMDESMLILERYNRWLNGEID